MTRTIYEQHEAAFPNVAAYVVALDGKRVATIAFKFGNAVSVYLHWLGEPMVRDQARGGGYDRQSAALASAARKLTTESTEGYFREARERAEATSGDFTETDRIATEIGLAMRFRDTLAKDDGEGWNNRLRGAGFEVWQAV